LTLPAVKDLAPQSGAFALRHADGCHYLFGWTQSSLRHLTGRALRDHDFLGLWRPSDRREIQTRLDHVRQTGNPRTMQAQTVSFSGEAQPCRFEFVRFNHPSWRGLSLGCRWRMAGQLPQTPLRTLALITARSAG
jgi:PAS domain